ncbi:MAG: hypothetical protein J6X57_01600 [Bacteroidales bacterium]|nr:hypothetical protein [Bacteroidales bacterium]
MEKFLIAIAALCITAGLSAQQPQERAGKQTKFSKEDIENFRQSARDRIQSEHIAYLTSELELTPEEAEKFWPVYNKAHQEQMNNNQWFRKALKDLKQAVKDGKSEAEIKDALDAYNKAKSGQRNVLADYQKDFIKILGVVKTAKLYVAEDSFRTRQIHNLTGGRGQQQPGVRPLGNRPQNAGKGQPGGPGKGFQGNPGRQPKEKPVQKPEDI